MARWLMTLTAVMLLCPFLSRAEAAERSDWPMWRYDASRSAASPHDLPDQVNLLWTRVYPARIPVWDDPLNRDLMPYDTVFEPVVWGKTLLLGFNDTGKVAAIDTETGRERWVFYTDGPVRLPPAAWQGRVFVTSDDGCLYCLRISDGSLEWKFSGAPNGRRILGNSRLISTWPARGGAVVEDGVVYFAAGIWPFMGVFIHALDAATGKPIWVNDGEGARYMLQPHNAPSFAGIAPQGALAISGGRLIVPGGRSVPACFDLDTGRFQYYELAGSGKSGGSFVAAGGPMLFNHYREKTTTIYGLEDGLELFPRAGKHPVIGRDAVYFSGDTVRAFAVDWADTAMENWSARKLDARARRDAFTISMNASGQWEIGVDASGDLIRAGNRLYAAGGGTITAIAPPPVPNARASVAWTKKVDGEIGRLIAADGKLFAVTLDGRIMAFGNRRGEPSRHSALPVAAEPSGEAAGRALGMLDAAGVRDGYVLLYGLGNGDLPEALACASDLRIIAVGERPRVDRLRRRFDRNGLAGGKISVFDGDIRSFDTPPYFSSLTILDLPDRAAAPDAPTFGRIFQSLRPYGGTLLLPFSTERETALRTLLGSGGYHGAKLRRSGEYLLVVREGPLPGAGVWTHNLGDIANTSKSDDQLVRLPLGILWFGGSSNLDVLPRHGHGPSEQVVGGRLFIEGIDCLSARDVYTGRVIWKAMLRNFDSYGVFYDETYKDTPTSTEYNQVHIPGANIRGTNFVAMDDRVYVIQSDGCHVLDAGTGKTLAVFSLPADSTDAKGSRPEWGYIGVQGDLLLAGRNFVPFSDMMMKKKSEYSPMEDYDRSASRSLVALNRFDGKVVWRVDAEIGFLHNGTSAGNGRLYVLDRYPPHVEEFFARRGKTPPSAGRLLALDLATGRTVWEDRGNVFGSFLAFSEERDILIQSRRPSRDMVLGETGKRIRAVRGEDGAEIWDREVEYRTFPMIHNLRIITESGALDLLTGKTVMREDPLTGMETAWSWKREYGCNYPVASEHLLSFRSGAAGFYDLAGDSGTGNFGGFKSGCTASLIAADGVLNAPDYTRTCSCSYQNQTSLALISMPENEMWTFTTLGSPQRPVQRVGINFGAPGDRISDDGTFWLEYPAVGGPSPEIPVAVTPAGAGYHRMHSSRVLGADLPWVGASGCTGAERIAVTLDSGGNNPGAYTVRLYFAESEEALSGKRLFDVRIQGKPVIRNLDIAKESGGARRTLVKEFRNIAVTGDLVVELVPSAGNGAPPVISGIEAVREDR